MKPSVILIEFNELCPSLMGRFLGARKLPNFQRLHDQAQVYVTDAEEEAPNLEPWIQWVTVHSGMSYREHQVFHLADGHTLREKCVWDVLSAHGYRVWVCGSMNIRYDQPIKGLVMPDPWVSAVAPSDPGLVPYMKFVQRHVQEHTNESVPLSAADYARFGLFMATHGLSFGTVCGVLKQLLLERDDHDRWKRAVILDRLQFDVFAHYYRKLKPHFSSFFLNSTAHFQHLYWRNLEPDQFLVKPTASEQAEYKGAILFGYQEMDRLLGYFFELADRDTTLILCTGLSQQPCLKYESEGGKLLYRPRDFTRFIAFTGIGAPAEIVPVMSECFNMRFGSERSAAVARERLAQLRINGAQALFVEQRGDSLYAGCRVKKPVPEDAVLSLEVSGRSAPFFDYFYRVDGMKSGMHHPDGILWIQRPDRKHRVHPEKVPLTAIAPLILDMFSVAKPESMLAKPSVSLAGIGAS
jgi:hypothetical protein